uniref:Uncharacterized protein n=1 Tax=Panagrolaimus superbus TaxID=310955 RepID=A0A914ZDM6_9BILA
MEKVGSKFDISKMGVEIKAKNSDYEKLLSIQSVEESFSSELTELFGCSYIKISNSGNSVTDATVIDSPRKHCGRCRRLARLESDRLCDRCLNAVSSL